MDLKSVDMVGCRKLFDISFRHLRRRRKIVTVSLLKGRRWFIFICLGWYSKEKAVISDSLDLFFIRALDDWASDSMGYLLVFLIFLLEFHALMLSITGAADLDLNGMVKNAVQDCAGGDRITQVFSPGLFFHVGCKDQRAVELVALIHEKSKFLLPEVRYYRGRISKILKVDRFVKLKAPGWSFLFFDPSALSP